MTKKKKRQSTSDICDPIGVYVLTQSGIELPRGTSEAHAWRDEPDHAFWGVAQG